jgi:hypothetical protein
MMTNARGGFDLGAYNRAKVRSAEELYIPEPNTGCWLWLGATSRGGYGAAKRNQKQWAAHRLMWTLQRGPIPEGLNVLHRCDTPLCVNPDHLFLGTNADNTADMRQKGRGRSAPGEAQGGAKLTADQVRAIRADPRPGVAVARGYGITPSSVTLIKQRKNWRHVP